MRSVQGHLSHLGDRILHASQSRGIESPSTVQLVAIGVSSEDEAELLQDLDVAVDKRKRSVCVGKLRKPKVV